MKDLRLMKGNEALAEAAIRCGMDAYFGYPITPQSEVLEYLFAERATDRTGMVVLQAESEIAAINMVYGAAGCGKKVMTSSSSPGISLKQEGISYMVGCELPCLVVNVTRGGPGLGSIQPSQSDYFQACKGGGHGDYHCIVLAPNSVQEMHDFVPLSMDLAFKYRNPVIILSDGAIGQMMEKVEMFEPIPRSHELLPWATTGKPKNRDQNILTSGDPKYRKQNIHTSVFLRAETLENNNIRFQEKYRKMNQDEVRFEKILCDDAEIVIVAFGLTSRICTKVVNDARKQGLKFGLMRPITLYPFPTQEIAALSKQVKGFMTVEMNMGQMVEDVRLAVNGKVPVEFYGRCGGIIPSDGEIFEAIKKSFNI